MVLDQMKKEHETRGGNPHDFASSEDATEYYQEVFTSFDKSKKIGKKQTTARMCAMASPRNLLTNYSMWATCFVNAAEPGENPLAPKVSAQSHCASNWDPTYVLGNEDCTKLKRATLIHLCLTSAKNILRRLLSRTKVI